ncbi:short chain dehydrogenase [Nocardioides phosphati]|uniref:Short chain dehydrogenase n=1 Tax=Nocardioides phosphati TaxID=1867775 RepID=A0ABQ2NA69_9ACTN|nr:SDR family oxidoreductase [Nocardioides phosphati]GGO89129.1 short chain dehydrogenase [Nocardioides phosphati]
MSDYFVTGATGFIGRFLVQELIANREGQIYVLCRAGSLGRLQKLIDEWGSDRVVPVVGDLSAPQLGVDAEWVAAHRGTIGHFFHLAAIYDMTADDATNDAMNIDGTRNALELAGALSAGTFHQVSSVAAAGDYKGVFTEDMFDEGQPLPSPYHRTKFESEKIVREESPVPWRVYRPAIVVGHSETGQMDKIDGPYYFFPLIKRLRDSLPGWIPLLGLDLRDTNVVPVDYVAKAMDHIAHVPGQDGQAFFLTNPDPQGAIEMINLFCRAARAPKFATPIDRRISDSRAIQALPSGLRPASLFAAAVHSKPVTAVFDQTVGRLGIPSEVLGHVNFTAVFDSSKAQALLAGSGISVPPLESYAEKLWNYWEENLDDSTSRDKKAKRALEGKYVVITGASSGIGEVTAKKVAQLGGIPVLVARGREKLETLQRTIEMRGGQAFVYPCDLSDYEAIDALAAKLSAELPRIDFVVNSAGRSIRRSIKLSLDRFHDFERTMQLNYFGAIRLVMGLIPKMSATGGGHIVNLSSIAVLTKIPRFSAYAASKAALDSWSNVVGSELHSDGISFTTIRMPLVRTPMIAPTKMYEKFPTISPGQAGDIVVRALVEKPEAINTLGGQFGAALHTAAPKTAHKVLNIAYQAFPDSAAARAHAADEEAAAHPRETASQKEMVGRLLKGLRWGR